MADPPALTGVSLAVERLRRYNVEFNAEEIVETAAVRTAVDTVVRMIEEERAPGKMTIPLVEFTVEAVAFGAMTRVINEEPEMDRPQIQAIKNIIRFIFNDLLDD
jgi:hypothetical protein